MNSDFFNFNTAPRFEVVDPEAWEKRVDTVRATVKSHASDLAESLFPRGHKTAGHWRIGNIQGEAGESLSIATHGPDAGLWTDHATGQGGDMIDLWMAVQGYPEGDFSRAVSDLELHFGLKSGPKFTGAVHKVAEARKAQADREPKQDHALGAPTAIYHYLSSTGALLGKVSRYTLANGAKSYRPMNADGRATMPDPRPIYRLPQIHTAKTVVFVEGEKCADALGALGIEATSMMGGANALIEKTDLTPLAGKTVILWPDNDPPGLTLMERVRPALEALGCTVSIVSIPADKPKGWDAADCIEEHGDPSEVLATANRPAPASLRFRILTIDELADTKPPEWRIDGIFPTHGSSTIYGAYESFKTWVALDMLLSLATGRAWQGKDVKSCSILYIAGEGQHGLAHRVLGWCAVRNEGKRPTGFRALPEAVAIPSGGDMDDLLRAIDALPEPPGVIALDTITRMSGGGSLNDEKDMQAYVRGMDRLRLHTGAHIMNIGHSGKDKDKGLMGSVVLPAAMETIICCQRLGETVTLINNNPQGKQKDGPNFEDIKLHAVKAEFTRNDRRDETLIFMPDAPIVHNEDQKTTQRTGKVEAAVLSAITEAAEQGEVLGWLGLSESVSNILGREVSRSSLSEAKTRLISKGLIVETNHGHRSEWGLA